MATEDASSPEERDRLIAEALAHAEARDAAYRPPSELPPSGRWRSLLAMALLALSGVLAAAPPPWLRGEDRPEVTEADRALGVRVSLELQAAAVEAFRIRHQRIPAGLDELPGTLPGLRYVRSGDRVYQLVGYEPAGRAVLYDSHLPSDEVQDAASTFLAGVDDS